MRPLARLAGLVLLVVCAPWIALWLLLVPLFCIFGGSDGIEFAVWVAFRPVEKWIEPLLLGGRS